MSVFAYGKTGQCPLSLKIKVRMVRFWAGVMNNEATDEVFFYISVTLTSEVIKHDLTCILLYYVLFYGKILTVPIFLHPGKFLRL